MRTFTNTARDTENNRIPNWYARKASKEVRTARDSPVMNIKNLGDITNNPERVSSLTSDRELAVESTKSSIEHTGWT